MGSQELFHAVKAGYRIAKDEEESAVGDSCRYLFCLVYNLWLEKGVSSDISVFTVLLEFSKYPNTTQRHLKDPTKLSRKKWQMSLCEDKCKLLPWEVKDVTVSTGSGKN